MPRRNDKAGRPISPRKGRVGVPNKILARTHTKGKSLSTISRLTPWFSSLHSSIN